MSKFQADTSKFEDFTFRVTQAFFGVDETYAADATLLILLGVDEESGREVRELWSIGKNWQASLDGKSVTSLKNKQNFHVGSVLGSLVHQISEKKFGEKAYEHFVIGDLDPKLASTRSGTIWQMGNVLVESFEKNPDGTRAKVERQRPVEFLGVADGPGNARTSSGGQSGSVGSAPSGTASAAKSSAMEDDIDTMEGLKLIAMITTRAEFAKQAMATYPALKNNQALMTKIITGKLYQEFHQQ